MQIHFEHTKLECNARVIHYRIPCFEHAMKTKTASKPRNSNALKVSIIVLISSYSRAALLRQQGQAQAQ